MSGRWDILPASEQEQIHLASTTTTTTTTAATTIASQVAAIRRNLGSLIRQEVSDNDQILCYYRNIANDSPIPYLCDLGCCPHGCCGPAELAESGSRAFGWALALLVLFIIACVFAVLAMVSIYLLNRHRDKQQAAELAANSSTHSGSASQLQISGPTSYYGHESYYNPYASSLKNF